MKPKRTGGGALSALLTLTLLFAGLVVPAGTAMADELPQFTLTASSVRVGGSVLVTEVDACPPPIQDDMGTYMGHVSFSVIDANGVAQGWGSAQLDPQGHWDQVRVATKAKRVKTLYPTVTYWNVASTGTMTLTGECVVGDVSTPYESQDLVITGSAPSVAAGEIGVIGGSLQFTPSELCPTGSDTVQIDSEGDTNSLTQTRAVNDAGAWELEIPDWHPEVRVYLRVTCWQGSFIRLSYDDAVAEFVYDAHRYAAMGDSYSAGVGTFNYDASSGDCLRSPDSYVPYVASQRNLGVPFFVACSGAQTADLYGQNPHTGEARQLDALTGATRYVTLTIGGNDAGFAGVMARCSHYLGHNGWGCANDSSLVNDLNQRIDALAGTTTATASDGRQITALEQVYASIADAAPGAKVYVGGYPRLFGDDLSNYTANVNAPGGAECLASIGITVSYSDAQWLNQMADELNGVIEDAATAAQANGADVTFVPAALFGGHGLCDSDDPWLNHVDLSGTTPIPESLHPTVEGYQNGYGVAFSTIMN